MTGKGGLEGIVVGTTELSSIDGLEGRLTYRGYDIHDLARHSNFEEVCYLLWNGRLPTKSEYDAFVKELAEHRELPSEMDGTLKVLADTAPPMEALRTGVSLLASFDPDVESNEPEANRRKALRLTAQIPTLIAAYHRLRTGEAPVKPKPELRTAANFLYMLRGEVPEDVEERAMDVALILHADHGFNASTFSARVTTSTLSDLHSAITSAVGTLKGPLHGGANERVMKMLEEIQASGKAPGDWVREKLAAKERIMGFGHRVYKTLDPRAVHLKELSEELGKRAGHGEWYEMSLEIQKTVKDEKGLDANVDFFSASAYASMGIPRDLFTPIFALSRVSGWTAHCMEQYASNRLIRPSAEYVGSDHEAYTPIEKRA